MRDKISFYEMMGAEGDESMLQVQSFSVSQTAAIMLTALSQLKVYHWQTDSYARHMAFGAMYEALDVLVDRFTEVAMGKYGRPTFGVALQIKDTGKCKPEEFCDDMITILLALSSKLPAQHCADLLNIRDEMVAEFNKLKYLLTLN